MLDFQKIGRKRLRELKVSKWPDEYVNRKTGKVYKPHNEQEHRFVYSDTPRYMLLKGGEGAGKSVAGIIKTLNRLRCGMSGIMVSPDLPHFKKSLWPELVNWIPWQVVLDRHQYMQQPGWLPSEAFTIMVFKNELGGYSTLNFGGAKETDIAGWEGPNVSFVHKDEIRRHKTSIALKTFDGRARIPGPANEPPQIFLTTTPRKHWLYDLFGPLEKDDDPWLDFKQDSFVATILTQENEANLSSEFVAKRRQTLSESEARILLLAEWEDEEDTEKFVNIIWWDNCQEALPAVTRSEPMVIALDAAKGSTGSTLTDCFAVVGITRHPHRKEDVAVRYCGIWQAAIGQLLDYGPIETEIRRLAQAYSVIEWPYDPYQLHYICGKLRGEGVGNFKEFSQGLPRLKADKDLQNLIMSRRITHDGNPSLKQHIDNSNVKKAGEDGIRLVKRSSSLKIDAAVSLSMAARRILYYNV